MQPKTLKVTFWVVTSLFCLANFLSGLAELFPSAQTLEMFTQLGYPLYFLTMLGVAKVVGALAIIQTKYAVVREWAYAGFAFDYVAAAWSLLAAGFGTAFAVAPVVFLGILFTSYFLGKKVLKN